MLLRAIRAIRRKKKRKNARDSLLPKQVGAGWPRYAVVHIGFRLFRSHPFHSLILLFLPLVLHLGFLASRLVIFSLLETIFLHLRLAPRRSSSFSSFSSFSLKRQVHPCTSLRHSHLLAQSLWQNIRRTSVKWLCGSVWLRELVTGSPGAALWTLSGPLSPVGAWRGSLQGSVESINHQGIGIPLYLCSRPFLIPVSSFSPFSNLQLVLFLSYLYYSILLYPLTSPLRLCLFLPITNTLTFLSYLLFLRNYMSILLPLRLIHGIYFPFPKLQTDSVTRINDVHRQD